MDLFEETLKSTLISVAFLNSRKYRSSWINQVKDIDIYWDHLITNLKLSQIMDLFSMISEKNNVICEPWEIVFHTQKALTDWRIELMTKVANKIAQFSKDEVEGDFVNWNGHEMELV